MKKSNYLFEKLKYWLDDTDNTLPAGKASYKMPSRSFSSPPPNLSPEERIDTDNKNFKEYTIKCKNCGKKFKTFRDWEKWCFDCKRLRRDEVK